MTGLEILLIVLLAGAALMVLRTPLLQVWKRIKAKRERTRTEDALKHILSWQHNSKLATQESLTGALLFSPANVLQLTTRMQASGLIRILRTGIALSPLGEQQALQVVRAHRLWERHLSDEANMPMERLHQAAEKAEHSLTREELAQLDAHLGHPLHDPHGDPIPSADGSMAVLEGASLNEWPEGKLARIMHIEDEPYGVFREILSANLQPLQVVQVLSSKPDHLTILNGNHRQHISHIVAANIQVTDVQEDDVRPTDAVPLSQLPLGSKGEVIKLGPECHGFTRRRLLDLGLTPGTMVQAVMDNTFKDPRAFLIRGATIALRSDQSEYIWIRQKSPASEQEVTQ